MATRFDVLGYQTYQIPRHEVQSAAQKKAPLQRPVPLRLKLWNEIGRGNVKPDPGRKWNPISFERRRNTGQQSPKQSCDSKGCTRDHRSTPRRPGCKKDRRYRESFRKLVQEYRDEDDQPELIPNPEAARDRHSIDEGVQQHSRKRRHPNSTPDLVPLFPEMEMRNQRMLSEVNEQEPNEDQQARARSMLRDCFRSEIEQRHRHHESRR